MKTLLSNAWLLRCKKLLENVEGIFMEEAVFDAALDSDDLLYLKEQMEAEEDAERLLRRTEKRAFQAFKSSLATFYRAASLADSSPTPAPLSLRVEPKPKSGIRQQDLLKKVVEIKPKRPKLSSPSDGNQSSIEVTEIASSNDKVEDLNKKEGGSQIIREKGDESVKSLLGLAYESSDSED